MTPPGGWLRVKRTFLVVRVLLQDVTNLEILRLDEGMKPGGKVSGERKSFDQGLDVIDVFSPPGIREAGGQLELDEFLEREAFDSFNFHVARRRVWEGQFLGLPVA